MDLEYVQWAFVKLRLLVDIADQLVYSISTLDTENRLVYSMSTLDVENQLVYSISKGTAVAQLLRCCATNRKVVGSIPAGVIGIFQ